MFPVTDKTASRNARQMFVGFTTVFVALNLSSPVFADCTPLPAGAIGWWTADGNANSLVGTNHGTLQGGSTASGSGVVGTSFTFDGTNGFVQVPDSPLLRPTNLTVECWVRFTGLDSAGNGPAAGVQYIVFKQNTRSSFFEGYVLNKVRTGGNDALSFGVTSSAGQVVAAQSSTLVNTGVWYHVVGVRGSNYIQIYVNGVLEQQTAVGFPQDYGNQPLLFGTSGQASWDRRLKGNLDEVTLYNRPLSSNEIAAIYAAGVSGKCRAPQILTQPQSATVLPGSSTNFAVVATGLGNLTYQWRSNNVPITAGTNSTLVLTSIQPAAAGNYSVLVTDALGSTLSSSAVLTVLSLPLITQQPQPATNYVGQSAVFSGAATGSTPLSYRWFFGNNPLADNGRISGATSGSLTVSNLGLADAGNYFLVVTNIAGAATSSVAALTVLAQVCAPPPPGVLAWWRGDTNALDSASTNHGLLHNGIAFTGGKVGSAFSFDGVDDWIQIPTPHFHQILNSYTMEFWAWPTAGRAVTPESTNGSAGIGNQRYAIHPEFTGTDIVGAGVSVGTNGISVFEHGGDYHPSPLVYDAPVTGWTHIAVVYQNRQPRLYVNGVLVRTGLTSSRDSFPSSQFSDDGRGFGYGFYSGLLDEVSFYNRPLFQGEIQAIYNSSQVGKCPLPPSAGPLPPYVAVPVGSNFSLTANSIGPIPQGYQWYRSGAPLVDGARVIGATSNLLTINAAQISDAGNYFVVLSNVAGTATSSVAFVDIGLPPLFVQSPLSQNAAAGGAVQLSSFAGGTAPISYQWFQNAAPLSNDVRHTGTTTTNLTISNLVLGDSGDYTLRASNVFGTAISTAAVVTVFTPPSVTTQPVGASIPLGLGVTFGPTVSGTAPLSYQWLLNGILVPNATNRPLSLTNLVVADYGNYQLVVTNGGGAITSAIAQLTIGTVAAWGTHSFAAVVPLYPAPGLSNVVAVSAGGGYSLALQEDGIVYGWGSSAALPVPGALSGIVAISAGSSHALALRSNGSVVAWGSNSSGQTIVPASLSNVIAIAAGSAHSAALRADGTVFIWGGSAANGQANIPAGLINVEKLDAGGFYTVALRASGSIAGWGHAAQQFDPLTPQGVGRIIDISAGSGHSLAATADGKVVAWSGQRGSDPSTNLPPSSVSNVIAVAAGGSGEGFGPSFVLQANGTVIGWGPSVADVTNVPVNLSNVVAISAGASHALALINDGRPRIVRRPVGGTFYSGQTLVLKAKVTGNPSLAFQWFKNGNPVPSGNVESLTISNPQFADAGNYYLVATNAFGIAQSVAVPVNIVDSPLFFFSQPVSRTAFYGSPFSVGASVVGSGPIQLQWLLNGAPIVSGTNELLFDRALPINGGSYRLIASGPFGSVTSSIAQIPFSRAVTWGNIPGNTSVDFSNVVAVAAGYAHALGIRPDGTVGAWGPVGQATNVPPNLSNVVAIAGGNGFSVALKADGRAVSWGNTPAVRTNPPPWLSNVIAIAVGGDHSLALRNDGTVVAWGVNTSGQTNVPPGLSNVVAIAAGSVHSLALKSDGTVWGWGQVGTIPSNTTAVAVAAGFEQSLILQADGTVLGWTPTGASAGVPAGLNNIVAISAGGNAPGFVHAVALRADGSMVAWGNNSSSQINVPSNIVSAVSISAGGSGTIAYLNDRSPVVTAQSASHRVARGTNVLLAALAVGQPAVARQWRFKGLDIPGATNATLTLTNVDHTFSGDYHALISNSLGATNSQTIQLDVGGGLILVSPTIDLNRIVSFNVADISGTPLGPADLLSIGAQASTNFVNWETLTGALAFTNGTIRLRDVSQTNYHTRFYRLFEQ